VGWWPCPACCGGNNCNCPGNIDLTISGVTPEQCSVTDINTTFDSVGTGGSTGTDPVIGSFNCSSTGGVNLLGWSPYKRFDDDSSSCSVISTLNGIAVILGNDGYIWVLIDCEWKKTEGFSDRIWRYSYYFKSTDLFSSYVPGDAITFTYDQLHKDGTLGGSYPDPGQSQLPFDASSGTVSATFVGCCYSCDDSTPDEYQVTIGGVANSTGCTDCVDFNGTYVLSRINDCTWNLCATPDNPPTCSGQAVNSIGVTLSTNGDDVQVYVRGYQDTECLNEISEAWFNETVGSDLRQNCEHAAQSVSRVTMPSFCDWSAATCTVTAN
jgi:hypothetical protein